MTRIIDRFRGVVSDMEFFLFEKIISFLLTHDLLPCTSGIVLPKNERESRDDDVKQNSQNSGGDVTISKTL